MENKMVRVAAALQFFVTNERRHFLKRTAGDRRAHIRFEVFGLFWGTFDVRAVGRVHNLTASGAMIEVSEPLAVESIQSIGLISDTEETFASVRVRHLHAVTDGDNPHWLVGVEFISLSSPFQEAIDRVMIYRSIPAEIA